MYKYSDMCIRTNATYKDVCHIRTMMYDDILDQTVVIYETPYNY